MRKQSYRQMDRKAEFIGPCDRAESTPRKNKLSAHNYLR